MVTKGSTITANLPDPPFQFFEGLVPRLRLVLHVIIIPAVKIACRSSSALHHFVDPSNTVLYFLRRYTFTVYFLVIQWAQLLQTGENND